MIYKHSWDKSYTNNENTLYYPDEYLVRFVNRYIKKWINHVVKNIDYYFLDIGCGIGRNIQYLVENGYRVTGIDISTVAINNARKFLNYKKTNKSRYNLINSSTSNFIEKKKYDTAISCAALDSMPTKEIDDTINNVKYALKKMVFFI